MAYGTRDILLVEDSDADIRFIKRALERAPQPFRVDTAPDVRQAWDKISDKRYDCLLIDHALPGESGASLLKRLSASDQNQIATVMISGQQDDRVAAEAIKLGALDYLRKHDLDQDQLSAKIDRAILRADERRSESHRQLLMENFAGSVAHDLLNPLNGVIGYLELAQQITAMGSTDKLPEYLGIASQSAEYMRDMVTGLLHFARTGTTGDTPETVHLFDAVRRAQTVLQEQIEANGAVIGIGHLPTIEGFRTDLVQLFQNLIANSIKYASDEPPFVFITAKETADSVIITVSDNGIGIKREYQQKVFAPLFRINGSSASGVGLGLATCDKIATIHRGRIWCESDGETGSNFFIALPKKQPNEADDDAPMFTN